MANSNGWGDGASNNIIYWGQGAKNNSISWGDSYLMSWSGNTNITGNSVFVSTWNVSASEEIELPYLANESSYSGTIHWGDGTTSNNEYANRFHTYDNAGEYTIIIEGGDCIGWNFGIVPTSRENITSIINWGQLQFGQNLEGYFLGCTNLDLFQVNGVPNLTNITSFHRMFKDCVSLTSIQNINNWDTSNITSTHSMFSGCTNFNQFFAMGTKNVATMIEMFLNCTSFNSNIDIDTSLVTDMTSMFKGCSAFNQPLNLVMDNVEYINSMLEGCTSFNQDITDWAVQNILEADNFMKGAVSFQTSYLDSLYNNWSQKDLKSAVDIYFETQYTSAGLAGRNILTNTYNWVITDLGQA